MMHVEDLAMQNRCFAAFEKLAAETAEVSEELRRFLIGAVKDAKDHAVIIERFGRFPHRNVVLGRSSTPEEVAFLMQPGSAFQSTLVFSAAAALSARPLVDGRFPVLPARSTVACASLPRRAAIGP